MMNKIHLIFLELLRNRLIAFSLSILTLLVVPATASSILFVVGSATLTTPDNSMKTLLEGMGHVLTIKTGALTTTADAAGKDLVLVSASVSSPDVNIKFKAVTQPVMVLEVLIFDDMAMTGITSGTHYGSTASQTGITIFTPRLPSLEGSAHPMAAGLSGTVTVYTSAQTVNWGVPGPGAENIAGITTDGTKVTIFGYPAGATMVGMNAPGRRVGFFPEVTGPSVLTTAGTNLFKAAVNWAMSLVPPTITVQPLNQTSGSGQTATFCVTGTGTPTPTFQWRKNSVNITGATSTCYTTPATSSADNGALYSVVLTNSAGSLTSGNATLTVTSLPIITTQPANLTVNVGQSATFSVVATSSLPLTYQWQRNGGDIAGETSATYLISITTAADGGASFRCMVSNSVGNVTSSASILSLNGPPVLIIQPAPSAVTLGQTATFTISAMGTVPITYQWRKNLTNISGATGSTYTTPATVAGDNFAVFSCIATNSVGSTTSENATLTIQLPPAITQNVISRSSLVGLTSYFNITVTGTGTITYQWFKNGVAIPGATSSNYATPPLTLTDNGTNFSCTASNLFGSANSAIAILTVNPVALYPFIENFESGVFAPFFSVRTFSIVSTNGPYGGSYHAKSPPNSNFPDNYRDLCLFVDLAGQTNIELSFFQKSSSPPLSDALSESFTDYSNAVRGNGVALSVDGYNWIKLIGTTKVEGATSSYRNFRVNLSAKAAAAGLTLTSTTRIRFINYSIWSSDETYWDNIILHEAPPNIPPTISITSPAEGSVFANLSNIPITNNAADPDGSISKVEYYRGGTTLIGTSTVSPFAYTWNSVTSGSYSLTAKAYDNDGGTTTSSPISISVNPAAPSVVASATPLSGGVPLNVSFTATNSGGAATDWSWNFGDGTSSSLQNPSHSYTSPGLFTARVTATGLGGNSSYSLNINVVLSPSVSITATPMVGSRPLAVSFTVTNSGGAISNYAWAFGNGGTSSSANPVYTYTNAGSFTATLNATNVGGTSSASQIIVVNPLQYTLTNCVTGSGTTSPPVGNMLVTEGIATPLVATPTGTSLFRTWRVQSGSAVIANPSLATTSVILSSNATVCADFIAPPNITITATPNSGTRPLTVSFSVTNTGGAISNYAWNFGNGGTSNSSNPVFTYAAAGTFTATLTASNFAGSSVANANITVDPIQYILTNCITGNGTSLPPVGTMSVTEGVSIPIVATPSAGNWFQNWRVASGAAVLEDATQPSTSVILSSNATVCADFLPDPVLLTVVRVGNGATTPTSSLPIPPGQNFNIGAIPDVGFKFLGWSVLSGDAIIANPALPSTHLTLTNPSTIQAEFIPENVVATNKKLAITGELADASGNKIGFPNPEIVDVSISLWTSLLGGTSVYSESFLAANGQGVSVEDGFFVARLGEGVTLANLQQVIAANPQLWVEITVESPNRDVLEPRTPLTASAYALGGVPTLTPSSGNILRGTGEPNSIKVNAMIGSYYVNDADHSTWVKISNGWSRLP